ncbi:MAG: molybdenum cofactor biosynthesis protein MoaE, partial [Caulobacteraceae bacterium]
MIRLSAQGFDPGAELSRFCAGRRKSGAVASFVGLARDEGGWEEGHGPVLELDAYPGFTETEIANIAREAKSRFSLDDLAVIHRFGAIGPGEPIVLVLTAAGHRRE